MRAVWIATVENIDWPSSPQLSTAVQQSEMIALLDLAKASQPQYRCFSDSACC